MSRFYFDLVNGDGLTADAEGLNMAPDQVEDQAINSIRSLLAEEVRHGCLDLSGRIEIRDERRAIVRVVPFADAVRLRS